jgi:tRNA A37 threonylcarbamoyltransferase TsaD
MLNKNNFNFSFSGLKTAVLYETKKHSARNASLATRLQRLQFGQCASLRSDADGPDTSFSKEYIAEICHEFQQACVDVLVAKTIKAAKQYNPKTILLAGGVSANKELREQLGQAIASQLPVTDYQLPDLSLTGDNAVMIASAASFRWEKMSDAQKKKALDGWKTIQPDANLKLK